MAAERSASRRRRCSPDEVRTALATLGPSSERIPASDWPALRRNVDLPGLYSWWVDADGAGDLASGIGLPLSPGRIYAGLTGATKWPSGKLVRTTLRQRIGGNHLHGTVYGSTFRRTLAASLRHRLGLVVIAPGRLAPESERELTEWIREYLEVAIHPFAERDALADLEHEVLKVLDPPLNLDGMPATPLRTRVKALRADLTAGR